MVRNILFSLILIAWGHLSIASITLTIKNNTNLPIKISFDDDYCMYYPKSSRTPIILGPHQSATYGQADKGSGWKCFWASHHHYRIKAAVVVAPYIYVQRCVQAMGDESIFSTADECQDSQMTDKLTMTRSGGDTICEGGYDPYAYPYRCEGEEIMSRGEVDINHAN
ncbi:hypothetical protein [Piscirickettsia litoralis]|uniref:Secreted protein n=1 Tax=Piscirickettsia litoralis TaxID=1891921 RepID=A0ABX3A1D5_9GAMM|nr:hypothetical protein [Piscirickettsia litoralis]ODN42628.1 hypothetical protein BGC07_06430 [Piscirickettsia litoralis]